jgi:hypothetical protein
MALKGEFRDDADLSAHLEISKAKLQWYFKENYHSSQPAESQHAPLPFTSSISSSSHVSSSAPASPQKDFTARYEHTHVAPDELAEFWSLKRENFKTCDPLQWWLSRKGQFLNLYRLSRDIFSIPGKFYFTGMHHVF